MDVEKEPRPDSKPYLDFEVREPHIPKGFVKFWMMSAPSGLPIGRYGQNDYGRCRYGQVVGIYGYDRYGSCVYN